LGEKTHEELIAGMTAPFEPRLAELEKVTKGVGGGALRALQDMLETTSVMPGFGATGADHAAKLRADTSLPQDHRTKAADGTVEYHKELIGKHYEAAVAAAARDEAELTTGLLPKVVKDEQRGLVRGEIDRIFAGKSGQALATAVLEYVGKASPAHTAELLGEYGQALFRGAGVADRHKTLKAAAVAAYLKRTDGTDRQIASRAALQAFKAANVPGALVAYRHAGLLHLNRDAALPLPGSVQVTSVTARGRTVKR
jgi:hypothetical protein